MAAEGDGLWELGEVFLGCWLQAVDRVGLVRKGRKEDEMGVRVFENEARLRSFNFLVRRTWFEYYGTMEWE